MNNSFQIIKMHHCVADATQDQWLVLIPALKGRAKVTATLRVALRAADLAFEAKSTGGLSDDVTSHP